MPSILRLFLDLPVLVFLRNGEYIGVGCTQTVWSEVYISKDPIWSLSSLSKDMKRPFFILKFSVPNIQPIGAYLDLLYVLGSYPHLLGIMPSSLNSSTQDLRSLYSELNPLWVISWCPLFMILSTSCFRSWPNNCQGKNKLAGISFFLSDI